MAAFDFKKEFPEFYLPARTPHLIEIPELPYLAVRGNGDPNAEGGEYKAAVGMLYAVAYTIKMSRLSGSAPEGYFDYVVPPLEGLWWTEDGLGMRPNAQGRFPLDRAHPPAGFRDARCLRLRRRLGGAKEGAGPLARGAAAIRRRPLGAVHAPRLLRRRARRHLRPWNAAPPKTAASPTTPGASTTSSISATPAAASRSGSGRSSAYR